MNMATYSINLPMKSAARFEVISSSENLTPSLAFACRISRKTRASSISSGMTVMMCDELNPCANALLQYFHMGPCMVNNSYPPVI